ncbi:FAD-dependent monooxygenase [Acidimangrovimonas sediminis]|uniref:FAD-dependent monooxygenase n=1 Tax=Acidimangrovimonas sediminis TaxID=2056283 RepID=UPI000C80EF89|nr:FAD-dependent monooxygenase [Acidimangrovimonas sediminis]
MRPAGRAETDSLYFTYPAFDPPRGAARHTLSERTPVAIVGAGPVGMLAALTLARHGVRSVLLEARGTFNDGSRAICVARQSFHILQSLGAVAPFEAKALGWTTGRSFYRGQQILEFEMPDGPDERFRPMYNLEQQYIEQFLWEAIRNEPLVDIRWQSAVTGLVPAEDGVALDIADPEGSYTLPADWVLAADGARSAVRRALGLRLQGENYEGRYVIADVKMAHDYPTIRRALFDPACRPGGTVLIHRQPDDIWRIDYQLGEDEDAEEAIREDVVRASVASVLAEIGHDAPWELEWWSVYSANTLALDEYRHGRVVFIGDSAHIVPIFGVRGLNNGLADAHNIGWKLGRLLTDRAGPGLIDSYTPERRGATLDVFANASKSARFMTPPTRGWQVMRDAALGLALTEGWAGALANPRQMTPFTYADSPAVLADDPGFAAGPAPGAAMIDLSLGGDFLSDRLPPDFTLVCFDAALAEEVAAQPGAPAVVRLDDDPRIHARLATGAASAYLVRPDLHIGARWRHATAAGVAAAMHALTFREETR